MVCAPAEANFVHDFSLLSFLLTSMIVFAYELISLSFYQNIIIFCTQLVTRTLFEGEVETFLSLVCKIFKKKIIVAEIEVE